MNMDLLEIKFKNQENHQQRAFVHEDIANDIFIQLTKLFISLSIFLITFSSPIFLEMASVDNTTRFLLFTGWLFLIGSILAGILQIFVEENFNKKLANYYHTVTNIYATAEATEEDLGRADKEKGIETIRNFTNQSSMVPFSIEAFCFITGLLFIVKSFYNMLFFI